MERKGVERGQKEKWQGNEERGGMTDKRTDCCSVTIVSLRKMRDA